MDCSEWQVSISALVDGEDHGPEVSEIESHVAGCASCAEYWEFAHQLRRSSLRQAEVVPDLEPAIAKRVRLVTGLGRWTVARAVLAICALEVMVFSVPDMMGNGSVTAHDARHLGSFSIAFGMMLMIVVVRPTRARMMLPVAGVLAVALTISASVDLFNGQVPLLGEARHLPEVISVGVLWILAVPHAGRKQASDRAIAFTPRLVDRRRDTA